MSIKSSLRICGWGYGHFVCAHAHCVRIKKWVVHAVNVHVHEMVTGHGVGREVRFSCLNSSVVYLANYMQTVDRWPQFKPFLPALFPLQFSLYPLPCLSPPLHFCNGAQSRMLRLHGQITPPPTFNWVGFTKSQANSGLLLSLATLQSLTLS